VHLKCNRRRRRRETLFRTQTKKKKKKIIIIIVVKFFRPKPENTKAGFAPSMCLVLFFYEKEIPRQKKGRFKRDYYYSYERVTKKALARRNNTSAVSRVLSVPTNYEYRYSY
jgi:hypothetical protein